MRRKIWAPILIILGFALVTSCSSSDDEVLDQLPTLPTLDAAAVGEFADEVIIPFLDMVDLRAILQYLPEPDAMEAGSGRAEALVDCQDYSMLACTNYMMSGYANLCLDDVTFQQVLTLDNCEVEGEAIDGSLRFTVTSNTTGSALYDVTIGGEADVDGTIAYSVVEACVDETFSDFRYEESGTSGSMTGELSYCAGDWPIGAFSALVTSGGFTIRYEMDLDGTGATDLLGYDNASNTLLVTCEIDLNNPYSGNCS